MNFFIHLLLIYLSSNHQIIYGQRYIVSTYSGSGSSGQQNGQRTTAEFFNPVGLALDSAGNVYVADKDNHVIRKITASTNQVSTIAGVGYGTYQDGQGLSAGFAFPYRIALERQSESYLLVADLGNHMIRKIVISSGQVSTVAGNGSPGFMDAQGTFAQFSSPIGVAIDQSGNGYVSDHFNNRIRKISPLGLVSTLAGSGTIAFLDGIGTTASFYWPMGIFADSTANVYVADFGNSRIRKITPVGLVSTEAGSGACNFANGPKYQAHLCNPTGVALDSVGNILIVDMANHQVRKVSTDGNIYTVAGTWYDHGFADGEGTFAQFNTPHDIVLDPTGNMFISDYYNHRIRKIVLTCQSNSYLNQTRRECVCNSGYFAMISSTCETCPSGKFLDSAYDKSCVLGDMNCVADLVDCKSCIIGEQPTTDRLGCVSCPTGTYRSSISQAACDNCPNNSMCTSTGFNCNVGYFLNSTNACEPCPSGTFKSVVGNSACQQCPINSLASSARDSCVPYFCPENAVCSGPSSFICNAGYELNSAANGCSKCKPSYIKASSGNNVCVACPASQEADSTRTSCQSCTFGYYKAISKGECVVCPAVHEYCGTTIFTCPTGYSKNSDGTDCVDDSLTSSQNLITGSLNTSSIILYGIGGVAVLSVLLFVFVMFLRRRHRQDVTYAGKQASFGITTTTAQYGTGMTMTANQNFTAYNGNMTVSSNTGTASSFLSIPAFLQFEGDKDFSVEQFLVKGGGGSVYTGTAFADDLAKYGTKVIVKKIANPQNQSDTDMFYQEVSIMYMLREHVNIAKIAGFSVEPYFALVMKFYHLGSLDKWLSDSENFRTKSSVLYFSKDLCEGVKHMHINGVAHCDLKPQNILLDTDSAGNIFLVLTDFGITRVVNKEIIKVRAFRAIAVRGASIAFASPETLAYFNNVELAKNFNAQRADLFSISVIMYCLINGGTKPWPSKTTIVSKSKNSESKKS